MRTHFLPGLIVLLLAPVGLLAAEDAAAIIESAIKAHGGEAKMARLKTMSLKAKGTVNFGADVPFTLETMWQEPDRLKNTVKLLSTPAITVVETLDGEDRWSSHDGKTAPLVGVKLDELRAQAHVRRLLLLTPLLHDKTYELSVLDQIRINDRPAVGVRVVCAGERDVKLYFDSGTHRLAKIERRLYDEVAKKESLQEEFFSDYQDMDGVPTAKKQVWRRDGTDSRAGRQLDFDQALKRIPVPPIRKAEDRLVGGHHIESKAARQVLPCAGLSSLRVFLEVELA